MKKIIEILFNQKLEVKDSSPSLMKKHDDRDRGTH